MTKRRKTETVTSSTAIAYVRVSALESQAETDLSLQQQERTLRAAAEAAGYTEVLVVSERHTASKTQPELERVLGMLADGSAGALFAAKIDRLSRKGAADVLRIADRAEAEGWRLVVLDVSLDTGTTVGRLVLTILAGVAEMESRRRSERMRDYHAARRARGDRSGRTYGLRNSTTPETAARILALHKSGETLSSIARTLDTESADGRSWHPTTVRRVLVSAA